MDLFDQFGVGKSFCRASIFLLLSEDECNSFWYCRSSGMSHEQLCGANMSALSISKHCILQPIWHILLFQTFIRPSHKTERTSTPWSIVAIRRLNLGLPGRSVILALYNNLRHRLCSEFTGSDPSNERHDGVKYAFLQSHILSKIYEHKCTRSPP